MSGKKTFSGTNSQLARKAGAGKAEKIQAALYQIADAASALMDMSEFYTALHRIVRELMYAENFYVTLYDPETKVISAPYFADEAGDVLPPPRRLDDDNRSLRGHVLQTGKTLHLAREEVEEGRRQGRFEPQGTPAEDWIGVPLKREGKTIGSLTVQSYQKGIRYTEQDVQLLEFVAQHIAVALTRARAIDETRQRNAELAIINRVQESLANRLEMQEIYTLVGDKISEITGAEIVVINTWDPEKETTRYEYLREKGVRYGVIERPLTPLNRIVLPDLGRGKTIIWNEGVPDRLERFQHSLPVGEMPLSVLIVPLKTGNRINTVISLQDTRRENAFDEATIRLVQTLADSTGIALENARLWEQEELYRKSLQRELEIGREIQAGFLPESLPVVGGWEIFASLMSAREVAGDFYDVFELQDGNIGLVIADVCDKGVGAALFMTLFRSLIRVSADQEYFEHTKQTSNLYSADQRLRRAMQLTNNYIAEMHERSGMFATLFFGILDSRNGNLSYINGGHEPPLIISAGQVRESLHKTGPAVGAIPYARFELRETHLQEGDLFFAFTDGVPDSRNTRGEFFGRDRLLNALHQRSASAQGLVRNLESELRQYIGGGNPFDDITLLAVRRLGI